MRSLLRVWAVFLVVTKRLLSQRGLALAATMGLVFAVALTMMLPLACSQPGTGNGNGNVNGDTSNLNEGVDDDQTTTKVPAGFPPAAKVSFNEANRLIVDGEVEDADEVAVYDRRCRLTQPDRIQSPILIVLCGNASAYWPDRPFLGGSAAGLRQR